MISIIIPVYNVQDYLEEMLKSVLNQSIKRQQYKLIIIDDCSTDNSSKILEKYEDQIDILITTEQNVGPGRARNLALAKVTSYYVMFVDSDDILEYNALEKLLEPFEEIEDLQISTGNYVRFTGERITKCVNEKLFEKKRVTNLVKTPELIYELTAWNKMYLTSFLRQINFKFIEDMLYEDLYPILHALDKADNIAIISDVVYRWRVRLNNTSITQNKQSLDNISDRLEVLKMMQDYVRNKDEGIKKCFEQRIVIDLSYYFTNMQNVDDNYLEYIDENVVPFLKTLDYKNIEAFNGYREITGKVEKRRYAQITEGLECIKRRGKIKFAIFLEDDNLINNKKVSKLKFECRFIVIGQGTNENVEYYNDFSKIRDLLNYFIIEQKYFLGYKQINYLGEIIDLRMVNLVHFQDKGLKDKEEISESQEGIFLSLLSNSNSMASLSKESLKGFNGLLTHANFLYKNSDIIFKFKNSKLVYKLYEKLR